jgi:two-component system chemotaxis response regulator CheB
MPGPIRVLVVDDSALVRETLVRGLSAAPDVVVVGQARDPFQARDLLVQLRPDVITLDVEMPRMDGITFLRRVMAVLPTPTIVLSSLTPKSSPLAVEALDAGAVDVIAKPPSDLVRGLDAMLARLLAAVRVAAVTRVTQKSVHVDEPPAVALSQTTDVVIGIGASTGGVAALGKILPAFGAFSPGIVVVQHMPAGFSADFAARLAARCPMRVVEATHGARVLQGHILVAPGGERHTVIERHGGEYRIGLVAGPPVSGHAPSVDVLFRSIATHAGKNGVGALLTGMGADGAEGLLAMREAGGRTFAQDKETCAVWGMPAAAVELNAAEQVLPLERLPRAALGSLDKTIARRG